MKKLFALLVLACAVSRGFAGAFSAGDLVVVRVGTGSAALSSSATAAFLDEFTTLGGSVQTIALPTSGSGANQIFTLSGSATSEGFLTLSANAQYLTVGGYNNPVGTATITSGIGNRVVGRVD